MKVRSLLVCCVIVSFLMVTAAAQVPPASSPLSPETSAQIRNLKLQADEAIQAGRPERAVQIYRQILQIDPDDPLSRQELTRLEVKKKEDDTAAAIQRVEAADRAAQQRVLQEKVASAEQLVLQSRAGGGAALLDDAALLIEEVRRVQPAFPALDRVQRLLDAERRVQRERRFTLWGLMGLVGLAILVPLGIYLWRGQRVIEMVDGPMPGQVFPLKKPATRFGALAAECDVTIADPLRKVSRRHCDVIRHGRHYFIVDYSTNGTQLNGQPVAKGEPVLLRRGDRIALSSEVMLVFR